MRVGMWVQGQTAKDVTPATWQGVHIRYLKNVHNDLWVRLEDSIIYSETNTVCYIKEW